MKHLKQYTPFLGIAFFLVALALLEHNLRHVHFRDIRQALHSIPPPSVAAALSAVAISYVALTLYDVLALAYVGARQPYRRVALVSFTAWALSNNVGYSVLSGGAIRYHFFSKWGLNTLEIGRLVAFSTFAAWIGFATLGGAAFLVDSATVAATLGLPQTLIVVLGILLLMVPVGYVAATILRRRSVILFGIEFRIPSFPLGAAQLCVGCLDLTAAATVVYFLLPQTAAISWPAFVGLFICAVIAGIVSQVPGGLGVFETVLLLFLKPYAPAGQLVAALVLYRVLYYLMPLGVALIAVGLYEGRAVLRPALGTGTRILGPAIPDLLAFSMMVCGCLLLVSGATPPIPGRLHLLRDLLPVPAVELSHFLASTIGLLLTVLAWSIHRRVNAAFWAGCILLVGGAFFSLLKSLDYEESGTLIVVFFVLLLSRGYFTRKASLFRPRLSPAWLGAVLMVLVGFVWLGTFTHKHVEYRHELWWQLTLDSDAPRFLRAAVGVVIVGITVGVANLMRPTYNVASCPTGANLELTKKIVEQSRSTYANLALLGDKVVMFSEDSSAFIMYAVEGKSWVSLGDPIGSDSAHEELVWRFRETCHRYGGWPVFYQVRPDRIPIYLDVGLQLLKLGEEAHVDLAGFSLEGGHRKDERHTLRKLEKEGCSFEIVPRERVAELLPELRAISDEWLQTKNTREKGFSLGFFNKPYLMNFPHAVVRRGGEILAFANIWEGAEKEELSIDLMRYRGDAPPGIMDYLFLSIMLWGKEQEYERFSLGMAPLAGLESRSLAPLWNRVGGLVFRYGEHFYNFQGLRHYKEKFDPVWTPMYLASPGGLALPTILANVAALISGHIAGIVKK